MEVGKTIIISTLDPVQGIVNTTTGRVTGVETVTVPAGIFATYRVEMTAGSESVVAFLRQEAPHIEIKVVGAGQPVTFELESIR